MSFEWPLSWHCWCLLVLLVLPWEFGGSSSCVCLYTRCSISVLSHTLCRLGLCCVPGSVISSYICVESYIVPFSPLLCSWFSYKFILAFLVSCPVQQDRVFSQGLEQSQLCVG